jgi:hypothetical protein
VFARQGGQRASLTADDHDGRFPTLEAVVNHYDSHLKLKLTADQKRELIEYLKSI